MLPIPAGTDPFNSRGMHSREDQQWKFLTADTFPGLGEKITFLSVEKKNGEKNNKQLLPPGADEENFSV